MPKVFISFDYKDIAAKKVVDNWKNQGLGTDISFTSEDGISHSHKGKEVVEQLIKNHIDKAQKILVLVGDNSHNRPWMDFEIEYGISKAKKIIWTQIPNTTGGTPKALSKQNGIPFVLNQIEKILRDS